MNNIYLEKLAGILASVGKFGNAVKETARIAGGAEYKPLLAKSKALANNIAKHQNENQVLGKATGAFDPNKFKSQAHFDLSSNSVNGPRMSSNSRKINSRQEILEKVTPVKDQAQFNMHKAQAKLGAGALAVGAGIAAVSGKKKQDNYQY